MAWDGSDRSSRLPSNWPELRRSTLERAGYRCEIQLEGCTGDATEVDHIVPGDDHSDANRQAACSWCHARKSSAEGNRARPRYSRRRPPERHPGLL